MLKERRFPCVGLVQCQGFTSAAVQSNLRQTKWYRGDSDSFMVNQALANGHKQYGDIPLGTEP